MTRLTWVQPEDLVGHELVASAAEDKDPGTVADVRRRWVEAGGTPDVPVGGASPTPASPSLRRLAAELLDELDGLRPSPAFLAREPTALLDVEAGWPAPPPCLDVPDDAVLSDRLHGAWLGRAAGCLLGKPVEKIPREGIREILRAAGRWPLDDWFTARGLPEEVAVRWPWNRRSAPTSLAETIDGMPEDDDLNFAMLALRLVERYGDTLGTSDVADAWLTTLPAGRVFTAERAAYRNLLLGIPADAAASHHNPFREWIGAAIRADVAGWVHPGDPAAAARLAARDAVLSHTGAGLHAALFVAGACSAAVSAADADTVVDAGLAVVPPRSRYAEAIRVGADLGRSGTALEPALDELHARYGHLHWVHSLNNGALTAFALTRSGGDLTTGICVAVTGGWDTDSVGATVGSLCGALTGARALPPRWVHPLRNRVATSLPGFDGIGFDVLAERTLATVVR